MSEQWGSAQARELGEELRSHREELGIPGYVLASRLGWSASKVSRIENGLTPVDEIDVVRYAAHCGVPPTAIDGLLELCRDPGTAGYWLSQRSSTLIFHESVAAFSSGYYPLVVPGLLQTEEYATALIGANRQWLIQTRMERQRVLQNRPFEFFVHEQALRLPVGGNRVMNEQLLKLVLVAEQPAITIRVVPATRGARSVHGGSFVLFRYTTHPSLVYVDHEAVSLFLEGEEYVSTYKERLADVSTVALGRGESREMLAALASEFDRPEVSPDVPDHVAEEQLQRGS